MKNYKTILAVLLLLTLLLSVGVLAGCGNDFLGIMPIVKGDDNGNEEDDNNGDLSDGFYIESVLIEKELEDFYIIDANFPLIKGFPGAEDLSVIIEEKIHTYIQYILDDVEEYKAYDEIPNLNSSFISNFGYYENDNLVSLWVSNDLYMGGTHGSYWIDAYTFNSKTGELYRFLDLFRHESGAIHIMDTILTDISENPDNFFESAIDTVWEYDYDFNYLIDGDTLTVYFPFYDLAPYASGMSIYEFTCYELEDGLKPEIFKAMRGQEQTENLFHYD